MPYISEDLRGLLDNDIDRLASALDSKGEYNYAITRLIHHYINKHGKKYNNLNDAIGILECAKLEFYRHVIGPYEDIKINEHGDIGIIGSDF